MLRQQARHALALAFAMTAAVAHPAGADTPQGRFQRRRVRQDRSRVHDGRRTTAGLVPAGCRPRWHTVTAHDSDLVKLGHQEFASYNDGSYMVGLTVIGPAGLRP